MNSENTIAEKICKYRKEQHLSQDELAKRADMSISTLKKYEIGNRNPKLDQLLKISNALGISINEFMNFEISTMGDVMSLLMKLDEQTDMQIEGEKDEAGNYIPESISIRFGEKISNLLASYLSYKERKSSAENNIAENDLAVTYEGMTLMLEHERNQLLLSSDPVDKS